MQGLSVQLILKSIVFTVYEHEYMNIGPPIIDLQAPLLIQILYSRVRIRCISHVDDRLLPHTF